MRIGRYWVLILMSFFLQSCMSVKNAEEVQGGKIYFERGDFKTAFRKLLPPAANGNAHAEYAIGYMYYYGYGVPQDNETGLFWMQKAADQHYAPASKALAIIHKQEVSPELTQETDEFYSGKTVIYSERGHSEKDEVLKSLEHPRKKEHKKELEPRAEAKKSIPADGYALQLVGDYDLNVVKKIQSDLGVQNAAVIWHAENKKKDWYVLMYGHYATVAEAKVAMSDLPKNLRSMGPWVRGLKGLG